MSSAYDFVVVGAGAMGRSTALYLTRQFPEAKCALIEQFKFEHEQGSSHSKIRIIRSTYNHPFYRDLCLEAMATNWPELEKLFKNRYLLDNPFLAFVQDENQFGDYLAVASSSTNIKQISYDEVKKQYPSVPLITSGKPVFIDTKSGVVMAERFMDDLLSFLKTVNNLDIFEETEVLSIQNNPKSVSLSIQGRDKTPRTITAGKVALSCGRWIGRLVPSVRNIAKQVRQTISFWKMKDSQKYQIGSHPCWCHYVNGIVIYALPDVEGDGLKFAVHCHDPEIEKEFANEEEFLKVKMDEVKVLMEQYFKGEFQELKKVEKCYYTVTKSEDFLIDWTDEHENILIVSPCSGHGFKFAPILGKVVADLLHKDKSIELFEKYRYLMRMFYHLGVNLE